MGALASGWSPRLPWWSRSVDSTYLTWGSASLCLAMRRMPLQLHESRLNELGFKVVGIGAYNREFARDVRAAAERHGVEALISDDYLEIEAKISQSAARIGFGNADGKAYRETTRNRVCGDLCPRSCSGLSCALLAADGI